MCRLSWFLLSPPKLLRGAVLMVNHRRFVASMYNTPDLVVRAFGQEPAKEMNDEADEAKTAVTVEAASPCLSELV